MPPLKLNANFGADDEEGLMEYKKKKSMLEVAKTTFEPVSKKWKETSKIRDFILYILFVIFFSLVVFNSKPGPIQFDLQNMHSKQLGLSLRRVRTVDELYKWLQGPFAEKFFPDTNPMGGRLDSSGRLAISGNSRIISAARLRVLRAEEVDCSIPNFLKDISGRYVACSAPYSSGTRLMEDMYGPNNTADVWESVQELDFTLP